ncbi:MAG: serine/threonine-protein kinase [Cyanobacteriota bacterium]
MDSIDPTIGSALQHKTTSNFPQVAEFGYQIKRELGHNRSGGRVTYLATKTSPYQEEQEKVPVVIKQFQFAQVGATWSDYEAHEREIELLQQLNSPSIPQYLDAFETPNGFCLVQEYKKAPTLAEQQYFTPEEVKQIAIAVLEVLVYLQQQAPPIIHRDIKPENILVDRQEQPLKVYLVDFGLAHQGAGDVAVSSVVKGTLGFMPPEQMFNRQLSEASDLYSLGVTLICLLTQTPSAAIGNLIDENYRLNFKHLVPPLGSQFVDWLSKMVEPNLKYRYPNAATALEALRTIDIFATATTSRSIERAQKFKYSTSKLILMGLGLFTLWSTSLSRSHREYQPVDYDYLRDALNQLQETGQCQGCNLRGADLRGMDLTNVDLTAADLQGADLRGADLRSSYLKNVDLTHANLKGADLRGAYLENADLTGTKLKGANLKSADFTDAILPEDFIPSDRFYDWPHRQ